MLTRFSCLMDIAVQFIRRNTKTKTNRSETSTKMKQAAEIVLFKGKTKPPVAKQFNV